MSPIDLAPPAIIAPAQKLWTPAKPFIIRASEDDHAAVKAMPFLSAIAGGARRNKPLWTPADLSTAPSSWHDCELSAKTLSGTEVSEWLDLSNNGRTASQATSANRPIYNSSDKWIEFDGSNDFMSLSSAPLSSGNSSVTMIAVVNFNVTSGVRAAFHQGSASTTHQGLYLGMNSTSYRWGVAGSSYDAGTISSGTWYIIVMTYNGSTRVIYSNGSTIGTNSYSSANWGTASPRFGSLNDNSNYFNGKLRTFIAVNAALSTAEREKVEGYLAHLWGLSGSLPGGHTYKTNPPYKA